MKILRLVLFTIMAQAATPQQSPASALLQGIVVKTGTTQALAKVAVELRSVEGGNSQSYVATTEQDGKFQFRNIQPGRYQLTATRDGYVRTEYGQRGAKGPGLPLALEADQRLQDVQLAMTPTGTVYGRISDPAGRPLVSAAVQAMKPAYEDGRRVIRIAQTVLTNDLGEYRLFWLAPGSYYIQVVPPGTPDFDRVTRNPEAGRNMPGVGLFTTFTFDPVRRPHSPGETQETWVPVYFPNSTDERMASSVEVRPGTTIGLDVSVAPVPTRRVRGVILDGVTKAPARNAQLMRIQRTDLDPLMSRGFEIVDPDSGTFETRPLAPGSYTFVATVGKLTGRAFVDIRDADIENLQMVAMGGFTLAGHIDPIDVIDTALSNLQIRLVNDPPVPEAAEARAMPSANGSFTLQNVAAGDYRVTIVPPPTARNIYVKSVRLGDADVLNGGLHLKGQPEKPVEIVLGTKPGVVEGRALNLQQQPAVNVTVALIPDAARRHRAELYRSAQTDPSGHFHFQGIPPGDYKVFAWEDIETGAWQDPDFIRVYEDRGKPVRVIEGGSENIDATAIPPR